MADYDDYYDEEYDRWNDYQDNCYDEDGYLYDSGEDDGPDYDYYDEDYEEAENNDDDDEGVNELVAQMSTLRVGQEYRRFGYFKCERCNKSWQSANTYCMYKGIINGEEKFEVHSLTIM